MVVVPVVGLGTPDTVIGMLTPVVLFSGIVNGPDEDVKVFVIKVGGYGVPPETVPFKSLIKPKHIVSFVDAIVTDGLGATTIFTSSVIAAQPPEEHGVSRIVTVPVDVGVNVAFKVVALQLVLGLL